MADDQATKMSNTNTTEVFKTTSRGRATKATCVLNKGTNVISSYPLAFVSRKEFHQKICDVCFALKERLHRCSKCRMVYYCNAHCQKKAWSMHKLECKYLKKISPTMPTNTVRLTALLLLASEKSDCTKDLESNSAQIRENAGEMFASMIEVIRRYLDGASHWSRESMFEMLCKVNCNAFTMCDEENKPLG